MSLIIPKLFSGNSRMTRYPEKANVPGRQGGSVPRNALIVWNTPNDPVLHDAENMVSARFPLHYRWVAGDKATSEE